MKKKISFFLAVIFIFTSLTLCVSAKERVPLEAYEGLPFLKGEIVVWSTEIFDPAEFEGDGPFDFLGVSIAKFERIVTAEVTGKELECYCIKVADGVDTFEAYDTLSDNENVAEVSFNYLEIPCYPDVDPTDYPENSPFVGKNEEELRENRLFVPYECTISVYEELDLAEFEGEGPNYLYGVIVEKISRVESETDGSFIYNIKWSVQYMDNDDVLTVFASNDNVISVEYFTNYGNGDVYKDGDVDAADYILVKRAVLKTYKPTHRELGYADVNVDGNVDVTDYVLIKRHCLKTYDLDVNRKLTITN